MSLTKDKLAKEAAQLSYQQIKERSRIQEALASPDIGMSAFTSLLERYAEILFRLKDVQDKLAQLEEKTDVERTRGGP